MTVIRLKFILKLIISSTLISSTIAILNCQFVELRKFHSKINRLCYDR